MNNEYKTLLIENIPEFKNSVINKIENINENTDESESELLNIIDELISIQYYLGIFNDSDEYDEILSDKINKIYDIEIISSSYSHNEFKYFLKSLLESYDLYLSEITFNIKITESIKIKTSYLIDEYDTLYYLDEISPEYLDEIYIYESESDYIDYIDEILLSDLNNKNSLLIQYFNYDAFISDLEINDELIIYEYNNINRYIENFNLY